jgi:acyl-CoA reductase-like NAD-dependent aldehyde dehydrogenase
MATHQIDIVIPENRRLLIEVPDSIRSGPATLIFVTPSDSAEAKEVPAKVKAEARARWQAMRAELAGDPRTFRQLSPEERKERLQRLQGIGRGLLSSSEEFARRKAEEAEIEERKLAR